MTVKKSISIILLLLFFNGCSSPQSDLNLVDINNEVPIQDSENKNLRLANGNWPPYNGEDLFKGGCDSQVISETFALAGYEVEFGYFPWARSYALSKSGEWDGTMAWDDTVEHRMDHWISAEPTSVQQWVFFYKRGSDFDWNTLEDLKGKTIGVTTGYVYSDAFSELSNDEIKFLESTSDEANFRMLIAGRIDAFPMEKEVGLTIIGEIFTSDEQSQIAYNEKPLSEFQSYLLLSKAISENEARMKQFDQAFFDLVESGRYAEIMNQCTHTGE